MDDYNLSVLIESKNEWCSRLVNLLSPCIFDGIKSIYDESIQICKDEDELEKYLMTFQNLLTSIPKWSPDIIEKEVKNIIDKTNCNYIEDLISCVHIAHLKSLTSTRVGLQQKKIDIDIPNLNNFIHKVYINTARKIYSNVYLYEINQIPLQKQKSNREVEYIIKESILNTIRENIPIEQILRAYIDETEEMDTIVEERKEIIPLENKVIKSKEDDTTNKLITADKNININSVKDVENLNVNKDKTENIKKEINEIDKMLNNNLEKTIAPEENNKILDNNNFNESNEINIETEIDESKNISDDKINISDNNEDVLLEIENLNSDIEDFDLESIKLE